MTNPTFVSKLGNDIEIFIAQKSPFEKKMHPMQKCKINPQKEKRCSFSCNSVLFVISLSRSLCILRTGQTSRHIEKEAF